MTSAQFGREAHARAGRPPTVAIVGRPNVGKSSLFNRIAGSRIAIEDPRPGTTRDRVSSWIQLKGTPLRVVELVDTAGIGVVDEEQVQEHGFEQIETGGIAADVLLLVLDVRDGVQQLDREAADMLRRSSKPVIVVANKADDPGQDKDAVAFHELGLGDPVIVSAKGRRNLPELIEGIRDRLPEKTDAEILTAPELYLAVVGRRNVGKSTLTNVLANDERVIASELEGTTRDSVDVRFEYDGKTFVAIDTAGVRRKSSYEHSVEFYSQSRSFRAVRRASVMVLMVDATQSVTKLDRKLVELAIEESKPIIIAVNKWDLAADQDTDAYREYLTKKLGAASFAPIVFLSAKERENVFELLDVARELHQQAGVRMGTGELNRVVHGAFERHHPQPRKNKLGRIYYSTQVEVYPPTVVVFVNDPQLFPVNWRTYLMRQLHEHSDFPEVPIRLKFKSRPKVVLD